MLGSHAAVDVDPPASPPVFASFATAKPANRETIIIAAKAVADVRLGMGIRGEGHA